MILGKKLQNPYTVENMKQAYSNLKKGNNEIPNLKIETNFQYVRFLPKNEVEYSILNQDKSLDIFDYPLDVEIAENGNFYKDPSTKDNTYTWYYCSVPRSFQFPKNVKVEVLADLFLPKGNGNDEVVKNNPKVLADEIFLDELEKEALLISGNLIQKKKSRTATWIPSGQITMQDDQRGIVPVKGCEVQTRRWFSTETAITGDFGFFNIGVAYNYPYNYSIKWERGVFAIFTQQSTQAIYNGPYQEAAWNLLIDNGNSRTYALAHRVAFEYYFNTPENLTAPSSVILYIQDIGTQNWRAGKYIAGYGIKIWNRVDDANLGFRDLTSAELFGIIAHELGHRVHHEINPSGFWDQDDSALVLSEAWGDGVKWLFRMREYGNCGDFNNLTFILTNDNFQGRVLNGGFYRPIVVDMIDNCNQRTDNCGQRQDIPATDYPNDLVSGYTIKNFEDAIRNANRWNSSRDWLLNNVTNGTSGELTNLFAQWE